MVSIVIKELNMQVELNDVIRSYDFKPMVGRNDCFVEGKVIDRNAVRECGYNAYKIEVSRDFYDGENQPAGELSRVGKTVFVPWRVSFMEYQGRIINLSRI
jgi:hypothetical protein